VVQASEPGPPSRPQWMRARQGAESAQRLEAAGEVPGSRKTGAAYPTGPVVVAVEVVVAAVVAAAAAAAAVRSALVAEKARRASSSGIRRSVPCSQVDRASRHQGQERQPEPDLAWGPWPLCLWRLSVWSSFHRPSHLAHPLRKHHDVPGC
jgi:hypothetical protein